MGPKKASETPQSRLGLLPPSPTSDLDHASLFGLALHAHHVFADEPTLTAELLTQQRAMEAEKLKAIAATHHVIAIHQQAAVSFQKLTQHYAQLSTASESFGYHDYFLEYLHSDLQSVAMAGFDVMHIGVGNIKSVVREPLYRPEQKGKRRGWRWLLGG